MSSPSAIRKDGEDVLVFVRAKPRARRSRILTEQACGEQLLEVEIALNAPPSGGAANEELTRFLAHVLGLSRSRVTLERGQMSRHKVVRVVGVSVRTVRALLGLASS